MADYEFTSAQKTVVIDGTTYTGKPVTADVVDQLIQIKGNAPLANRNWIAATFGMSVEDAGKLPGPAFYEMLTMAMALNGYGPKGEAPATETEEASPSTSESPSPTS